MNRRTAIAACLLLALLTGPAAARAATLFTLTGHGWGHGIGMSQYGSYGYAQHGWTYDRILAHYFQGTTLGTLRRGTREKVLLAQRRPSIHVTFSSSATGSDASGTRRTLAAGSYRVDPGANAGKLRLWSAASSRYVWKGIDTRLRIHPSSTPLRLDDTSLNGYGGDHWWGDFLISRSGGGVTLINDAPMERYVRGVVPCEMPASWAAQALKTQAVAARSYAAATRRSGSFDAYPDTRSQVYCPIERQAAASDGAVAATKRQVVMYQGSVATTFFSSSSGGRTSSISASWGGTDLPYLVPVRDRYDAAGGANPNHTWAPRLYTTAGLGAQLGLGHAVRSLDMTIDAPSLRVLSIVFHTRAGDSTLTASQVFSRLGLRSTYFRLLQETLVAPKQAVARQSFQLRGRLWPAPAGSVHLEAKLGSEGSWTPIAVTVALDSDGRFAIARSPTENVSYRIARRHVFSPVVSVVVHPVMTLSSSGGALHGHMLPRLAGATVTLQKLSSGRWTGVESVTAGGRGRYAFTTAVTSGTWRARFRHDADHGGAASPQLVIP
jgi:stage II sporulation protein D